MKTTHHSRSRRSLLWAGVLALSLFSGCSTHSAGTAPGAAAFALDVEVARNTFAPRDTPRFALAGSDFELNVPHVIQVFSCALNTQITKENAPYLFNLLSRSFTDVALSTYVAKNYYKRPRPFQQNGEPLAVPEQRAFLETDPSYPSGHTALGWGFALILSEIAPDRADQLLARGRLPARPVRHGGEETRATRHDTMSSAPYAPTLASTRSGPSRQADR
jgi:hypothetical protein